MRTVSRDCCRDWRSSLFALLILCAAYQQTHRPDVVAGDSNQPTGVITWPSPYLRPERHNSVMPTRHNSVIPALAAGIQLSRAPTFVATSAGYPEQVGVRRRVRRGVKRTVRRGVVRTASALKQLRNNQHITEMSAQPKRHLDATTAKPTHLRPSIRCLQTGTREGRLL